MYSKRSAQNKLRHMYKKFHFLPKISSKSCVNFSDEKRGAEIDKSKSLCPPCYNKLPWILQNESDLVEINTVSNITTQFKKAIKSDHNQIYKLDLEEIENKYRNLDKRGFELEPQDFSLEHRHKIAKLRFHQALLGGRPTMTANDEDYLSRIESKVEVEKNFIRAKRLNRLAEQEVVRERREQYNNLFNQNDKDLRNPLKKLDVLIIAPILPINVHRKVITPLVSEISSSMSPDSWNSRGIFKLHEAGDNYIRLAANKTNCNSILRPLTAHSLEEISSNTVSEKLMKSPRIVNQRTKYVPGVCSNTGLVKKKHDL